MSKLQEEVGLKIYMKNVDELKNLKDEPLLNVSYRPKLSAMDFIDGISSSI